MKPLRIGIFPRTSQISECVLALATLRPTGTCPELGISADVLGIALDIAKIPYVLVSIKFDGSFGSYDAEQDKWTGRVWMMI